MNTIKETVQRIAEASQRIAAIQALIDARTALEHTNVQIGLIDEALAAHQGRIDLLHTVSGMLMQEAASASKRAPSPDSLPPAAGDERSRSVKSVAQQLGMSTDLVRELFSQEPDVVAVSRPETRDKRSYTTLYIPESAVRRIQSRLAAKGKVKPSSR